MLEFYEYMRFQLKRIFKNSDIELYELALLTAAFVHVFFLAGNCCCIFLYYVLVQLSETYFILPVL